MADGQPQPAKPSTEEQGLETISQPQMSANQQHMLRPPTDVHNPRFLESNTGMAPALSDALRRACQIPVEPAMSQREQIRGSPKCGSSHGEDAGGCVNLDNLY